METLNFARNFLLSIRRGGALPAPFTLCETFDQVVRSYENFPELELEHPRAELIRSLLADADALADEASVTILMVCVALDPSDPRAVALLLERLVHSGRGDSVAAVAQVLAQHRDFALVTLLSAVEELRRRGSIKPALSVLASTVGHLRALSNINARVLGEVLTELLIDRNGEALDPVALAEIVNSARSRLQQGTAIQSGVGRTEKLLSLAERTATKLRLLPLSPPSPELPPQLGWPTRRLRFSEFAVQGLAVVVELLPTMVVGAIGERHDGTIRATGAENGHIAYGPYVRLPAGEYLVRAEIEIGWRWRRVLDNRAAAVIEVYADIGAKYLAQRSLYLRDDGKHEYVLPFEIAINNASQLSKSIEFRVWSAGLAPVAVSSVIIERLV